MSTEGSDLNIESLPQRRRRRRRSIEEAEPEPDEKQETPSNDEGDERKLSGSRAPTEQEIKAAVGREKGFEYLDHTADIQIHSWGSTLSDAFENAVMGMFGYMTDLPLVDVDKAEGVCQITAKGHDMESLLFAFMDEFLYAFHAGEFVCRDVRISSFDKTEFKIVAEGFGERFSLNKHPQGTEVKAITFSAMKILDNDEDSEKQSELYVIVDI